MSDNQAGAVDYERAKDYFWAKLADDRHGKGRMESAFYHTAQWIFMQGCGERDRLLDRIFGLECNAQILRDALRAHGEESARLIEQRDELLEALKAAEELHVVGLFGAKTGQIQQVNDMRKAAIAKAKDSHA